MPSKSEQASCRPVAHRGSSRFLTLPSSDPHAPADTGIPVVTLVENFSHYTVLFNGVPHLAFKRRELVGFSTWIDNRRNGISDRQTPMGARCAEARDKVFNSGKRVSIMAM